jgi:hypothetical protein
MTLFVRCALGSDRSRYERGLMLSADSDIKTGLAGGHCDGNQGDCVG